MISKKNDNKEISIYSYKSQNLTEFSSKNMVITLLSNFKTTKIFTSKKELAGDMLAFLLK